MGTGTQRRLSSAFLPGQPVSPSTTADLTDLENRVGMLEGQMTALTARVVALENANPLVTESTPDVRPIRHPRAKHT